MSKFFRRTFLWGTFSAFIVLGLHANYLAFVGAFLLGIWGVIAAVKSLRIRGENDPATDYKRIMTLLWSYVVTGDTSKVTDALVISNRVQAENERTGRPDPKLIIGVSIPFTDFIPPLLGILSGIALWLIL